MIGKDVVVSGGSAKIGVYSKDHCPPHATCRDTGGQWVVRISFSFVDPSFVDVLSILPPQNNPGNRVINQLASAVQQNLKECRRLWWMYQRNNPRIQAEGACCLNNSIYGSKTVRDATYDLGTSSTRLRFSDGMTMILSL